MNISCSKIDILTIKNGWDYTTLSQKSGISRSQIATLRKRETCQIKTALKLAKALGVDVTEIIETEG